MKLNRLAPLALLLALTGCTAADWAEIREYERTHNDCPFYAASEAERLTLRPQPQTTDCTANVLGRFSCATSAPAPSYQDIYDAALRQCEAMR